MDEFIKISKALSDPNRVRAFMAVRDGELCVCQIIELLGLAPSTVSKHMSVLKQAGLVESRKEERWMYYRLPDKKTQAEMAKSAMKWVFETIENTDIVCDDHTQLERIMKQNPSHLCRKQRGKKCRTN
jgi:DNA-binding transcriptional ArsR family regulator